MSDAAVNRPATAAASNGSCRRVATSSTAHSAGSICRKRRRKPDAISDWLSSDWRTVGVQIATRNNVAPINPRKAANQRKRIAPPPHLTGVLGPLSPLIATAEMVDGAPT